MKFLSKDPAAVEANSDDKARARRRPPPGVYDELNAFLGRGCHYEGKLTFEGTVRIDGEFSGHIQSSGTLIIGEGAEVQAQIDVGTVIVSGSVNGDIRANNRLELRKPAKLIGNLFSPVLVIEEGVIFEGRCQMLEVSSVQRPEAQDEPLNLDINGLQSADYDALP